ncbi:MAG TPA: EamA family transporter [Puia sp.]|nr:EamA family transporter [Puia sp.]
MGKEIRGSSDNAKYYFAAITAYTIWGFFSLVLRPLDAYTSADILFYRVFSCAIFMLVIVFFFRRKKWTESVELYKSLPPNRKRLTILLNIAGSIFLTGNWFSFIYVMNHISIKATSLAYMVCPILTTLLAFFILHEKLHRLQWLAVALSVTGCLLLSYADLRDMYFSLIVGFSYACYLVSQRKNAGFDTFIVLTFHIVLSSLILLPFFITYSGKLPSAFTFYAMIGVIAVFFTIIPLFLNLYALTGINSSVVGMMLNINPIIAFTLATWVFHEAISPMQIVSYSIILIAVIVFNGKEIFARKAGISK